MVKNDSQQHTNKTVTKFRALLLHCPMEGTYESPIDASSSSGIAVASLVFTVVSRNFISIRWLN